MHTVDCTRVIVITLKDLVYSSLTHTHASCRHSPTILPPRTSARLGPPAASSLIMPAQALSFICKGDFEVVAEPQPRQQQ